MYLFEKSDLSFGTVVWARPSFYYDKDDSYIINKNRMYVIVKQMPEGFLSAPITSSVEPHHAFLSKRKYPIKLDSEIKECLYCVAMSDIVSPNVFKVEASTMNYFRRRMYEKIVLGYAEGREEYNNLFVKDYLLDHKPKVDNIIVYPKTNSKGYNYYYIYDMDEDSYCLIELDRIQKDYYIKNETPIFKDKNIRFYTYYNNHSLKRTTVDNTCSKVKKVTFPKL